MLGLSLMTPALFTLGLALVARRMFGSWLAPGAYFALVWTLQQTLSLMAPNYDVWVGAAWWIFLTAFVFFLGSAMGGLVIADSLENRRQMSGPNRVEFRHPVAVLVVSSLVGLFYVIFFGRAEAVGAEEISVVYQLLLPFQFAGPLLGGMIGASRVLTGWRRFLTLMPLLSPATMAVLFTGRTAIIAPLVMWIAGYLTVQLCLMRGRVPFFTPKRLAAGIVLFLLFISIAMGIERFRSVSQPGRTIGERLSAYQGTLRGEEFISTWKKIRPSVLGNVYSFSFYFEQAWDDPPEPHGGRIIFAAPLDFLDMGGERYPYTSFEIEPGVLTNVYTMLRAPIDDFTIWGSLLWWFVIGLAQGVIYERVKRGRLLYCAVLAWFYVDTALIGGFFFRYNVIILAYLFVTVYLAAFARQSKRAPTAQARPAVASA